MNEPTRRYSGSSQPGTGIMAGRARTARARARAANSNDTTGSASASGPVADGPTEGDDASWDVSTSTPAEAPGALADGPTTGADGAAEEGDWFLGMRVHPVDPHHLIQVVAAVVVIVVVAAVGSTTAYRLVHSRDNRDPHPWETSVASNYTPPTTTPTPTTTPEAADSTLSEEEQVLREAALAMPAPERPAGMDEFTPEGAYLTAEYFLALYPYVYATGDLSTWQAMATDTCVFCESVVGNVTELHEAGGWTDPLQQEAIATAYGISEDDPNVWVILLDISHDPGLKHDGAGGTTTLGAEEITFELQLRWTGETWIVDGGRVQ